MQQTFVLCFKNLTQGGKTCAIKRQNSDHKVANLAHTKKFVLHTKNIAFVLQKNNICTSKIANHTSQLLAHFIILLHTFSAFSTLQI